MNRLKNTEELELKTGKEKNKAGNKLTRGIGNVFSGTFLAGEKSVSQFPFLLFLVLLAILYITNGNYAEKKLRALSKLNKDLKELRSEYITSKSELMFFSKQSEVAKATAYMGIKESVVPPFKIVIPKNNREKIKD